MWWYSVVVPSVVEHSVVLHSVVVHSEVVHSVVEQCGYGKHKVTCSGAKYCWFCLEYDFI